MGSTTTAQHSFANNPSVNIQRSVFDRSHEYKTTFDAGLCIPILVDLAYPGDTFTCRFTNVTRMATPIFPLMSNLWLDVHYFAVPMRLLWGNFKKMMGEQVNPEDSVDFTIPTLDTVGLSFGELSVYDYMGLPTKIIGIPDISAMPLRAYNSVWNYWYRDANLQNRAAGTIADGPDLLSIYDVLPRGKRKDYFSGALPWPQRGDPVSLPLGISAPIVGLGSGSSQTTSQTGTVVETGGGTEIYAEFYEGHISADLRIEADGVDGAPAIYADLSSATAATINQLRTAFAIQELYEKDARAGGRYEEQTYQHFKVMSPDMRMQKPEYLGGGSQRINATQVPQTSETTGSSPQGNMGAYVQSEGTIPGFSHSFTEHCIVLAIASVRSELVYQQGLNKMWSYKFKEDFYFPALANLGEQAVLNKEIYCQGPAGGADDDAIWGYQERWSEMRYKPGQVTGLFRSNASASLDAWHLSEEFGALPTLGAAYIEENPPMARVEAVPAEPDFIMDGWFDYKCARAMPTYSVPGLSRTL